MRRDLRRALRQMRIAVICCKIGCPLVVVTKFKRCAIKTCVSNSDKEPDAMVKKCVNSFRDARDCPSAMLDGIETTARRIWSIRP